MPAHRLTAVILGAALVAWAAVGLAQDEPAKDKTLDGLLEKLEGPKVEQRKADPKTPTGEVEPKDKALDGLLEKIGQESDAPPPPAPRPPGEPAPAKPGEPADTLEQKDQGLDRHLEEVQGKRRKPKDQQPQEGGGGPLDQAVKKMREVEKKLGETDTGETTRKKQGEIVQDLETILKRMRQAQGQGRQSRGRRNRGTPQSGNPGNQAQGQSGTNANGVGPMAPKRPSNARALVGDKDEWGHLPPELRAEMDNVADEAVLPLRQAQIDRYFLSVVKKAHAREE